MTSPNQRVWPEIYSLYLDFKADQFCGTYYALELKNKENLDFKSGLKSQYNKQYSFQPSARHIKKYDCNVIQ